MRIAALAMPAALFLSLVALAACGDSGSSSGASETSTPAASRGLTEDDVKALVTRRSQALATGVGSAPSGIKLTFHSVEISPARAPNAQDRIDGVHGDELYTVRVRSTSHRTWGNGDSEDVDSYYGYHFYRNEFGEWDSLGLGPVT